MRLVLLGRPGAGKGTQAQYLTKNLQIPQISTGDILRQAIRDQTPLGQKIQTIVESGQLVPDDIMIELIKERLQRQDCQDGFLLDGFPRTLEQAKALQQVTALDYVIEIDVPEHVIIERLTGRRIHPSSGRVYHIKTHPPKTENVDDLTQEPLVQREDDREATVKKRLKVYDEQTNPMIAFYKQHFDNEKPTYLKIDGTKDASSIKDELLAILH